jgi:hypothetical protein
MPSKNPRTRINETIQHIEQNRAAMGFSFLEMGKLTDFIRLMIATHHTADFNAFSDSLSLTGGLAVGNENERHRRRAIMLVWKCVLHQGITGDFQARMTDTLNSLHPSIDKLRLVCQRAITLSDGLGAGYTFARFKNDPLTFISENKIFIPGSTAGAAVLKQGVAAQPAQDNILTFKFYYDAQRDFYVLAGALNPLVYHPFQTASIPAIHWTEVPGRGNTISPSNVNPVSYASMRATAFGNVDFMVTTQLTGCAFCYLQHNGEMYASHIMPGRLPRMNAPELPSLVDTNGSAGTTLAQQLTGVAAHCTHAAFSNLPGAGGGPPPPPIRVFGRGDGSRINAYDGHPHHYPSPNLRHMSMFGVRAGVQWYLYSQSLENDTFRIMEARRIC